MAQEFASDNTRSGLIDRLKLMKHRGFFSFLFVTLSVIFILVTFAAVQQQQTTQSKATGRNLCEDFDCSEFIPGEFTYSSSSYSSCTSGTPCCQVERVQGSIFKCVNKINFSITCSSINTIAAKSYKQGWCNNFHNDCEWKNDKCVEKELSYPPPGGRPPLPPSSTCVGAGEEIDLRDASKSCCDLKFTPYTGETYRGTCETKGSGSSCKKNGGEFNLLEYPLYSTPNQVCCSGNSEKVKDPYIYKCIASGGGDGVKQEPECTNKGGTCINTNIANSCLGTLLTGYCPTQPANIRCCVQGGSGGPPPPPPPPPPGGGSGPCANVSNKASCDNRNDCEWNPGNDRCRPICPAITLKSQCDTRADCEWGGNKCEYKDDPSETPNRCQDVDDKKECNDLKECFWENNRCKKICGEIRSEKNCTNRNDCEWKANECVEKKTGGPTTDDVKIDLKLAFQGITGKDTTKKNMNVRVRLVDAKNKEKVKDNVKSTVGENGIWSGTAEFKEVDVKERYYILIKGPHHLQKKICTEDASDSSPGYYSCTFGKINLKKGSNSFDFRNVKLLVGDLDQNGVVDSVDTSIVFNDLLLPADQRQSSEVLERSDLNLDGIVSTQDWVLILEALKIKYDEQ